MLKYSNLLFFAVTLLALNACGNNGAAKETTTVDTTPIVEAEPNEDAPIITLDGENPLYLQHGQKYNEPGATALDDVDGDVEVKISGKVDVFTVGTYYVTYTSKDFEGNTATVQRKVIVQPIVHHGLTYKPVVSPITGKVWLDRNIGATEVCSSESQQKDFFFSCNGDTYQWGRNTDGHEQYESQTTTIKGKTITDSGDKFVIGYNDWTSDTHRSENWRATDGHSVCPVHYRVPTREELKSETKKLRDGMVDTHFLHLGYSKERFGDNGAEDIYGGTDLSGFSTKLWTNTVSGTQTFILNVSPYGDSPTFPADDRAEGHPVRCIQN